MNVHTAIRPLVNKVQIMLYKRITTEYMAIVGGKQGEISKKAQKNVLEICYKIVTFAY